MHSVTLRKVSAVPEDIAVGGCHLPVHFLARRLGYFCGHAAREPYCCGYSWLWTPVSIIIQGLELSSNNRQLLIFGVQAVTRMVPLIHIPSDDMSHPCLTSVLLI